MPGLGPGAHALADEALQTQNAPHGCHLPHRMAPAVVHMVYGLLQGPGGCPGEGLGPSHRQGKG